MPLHFSNLFSTHKLEYFKGKRPSGKCILCSIVRGRGLADDLTVYRGRKVSICVNKYPYNSGHILIFPNRHTTDYRDLTDEEENEISLLLKKSLTILEKLYNPTGFNFGYNMGNFAGASIPHLHLHVIPRYMNELGFIDIIGGAKIIVEDPIVTMKRLRDAFSQEL